MKEAKIIIGANFGDEGKGLATDYFADKAMLKYNSCLVVCCNGGAQKGHTVTTPEGIRHVTHHFGTGVLTGADTYLSQHFILNPILFRLEYEELLSKGYNPNPIYIHEQCMITTPYEMLVNQMLEILRGNEKHGSCGLGIYETIQRHQSMPEIIYRELYEKEFESILIGQLRWIRDHFLPKRFATYGYSINNLPDDMKSVLFSEELINNFINDVHFIRNNSILIRDERELLSRFHSVIFECSQGLLLDQNNREYFPHLTPSNTGVKNPLEIINHTEDCEIELCYVTRSYVTRHGTGRFDTECNKDEIGENIRDLTNVPNEFQDTLRYGKLDVDLLRKSIMTDVQNIPDCIKITSINIMVTHLNETEYLIKSKDYDMELNDFMSYITDIGTYNFNFYLSNGMSRNHITKTF